MPTYRCYCCQNEDGIQGKDFVSEPGKPVVCPSCGEPFKPNIKLPRSSKSSNQERGQGHVAEVAVIHFDAPKNAVRGTGYPACSPTGRIGTFEFMHATGAASAVSCEACMKTDIWRTHAVRQNVYVPPEHDIEVVLSPETGVVTPTAKG